MLFLYWAARGLRAARLLKAFGQAFIWVFSVPRRRSAASASRLRHVDLAHHPGFVVAGDVAGELQTGVGSESPDQFLRLRSEEHTSELQSLMRISYAVFCLKKQTEISA